MLAIKITTDGRIACMTLVGTALLIGLEMTDDGEDFCQVPRWAMESLLKGLTGHEQRELHEAKAIAKGWR